MEGQAMLGRIIAAVGVVLGFIAIWVKFLPFQKYSDDGTILTWLLILGILTALLLVGAFATGRRDLDIAVGAVGGAMFGFYLFLPVLTAFDHWKDLDTGAWLGVCSGLTVVGALIATWKPMAAAASKPAPMGMLLALVGLVLVFVGIWPKVSNGQGSYWNTTGLGHSGGIFLIILVVLGVLALGAAYTGMAVGDVPLLLAAVTFGFTITLVVGNAFNSLGDLKVGAWLAAVGGILELVGVAGMRKMAMAGAPAPMTTPAPPPPA